MSNPGDKFPERNLPGSAENWGREIERRIENAEKLLGATSRSVRNAQRAVSGQSSVIETQIASVIEAKDTAREAQVSADGKNSIWYLPEAPEPPEGAEPEEYFKEGDTWFDTSDDNRIYEWELETDEDGAVTGSWVPIEFGTGAIADGAIDGEKIAQEVNDAIQNAVSDSSEAKSIAESAVVDTYDEYATSNDPEDPPTSGWSTDTPPWSPGTYIWRRNVVTYGNGTTVTGLPVLVTGNPGSSGTGVIGSSVTYQTSTSATTPPGGTWEEDVPPVAPGEYLWTRTIISYSDSTSTTLYSVGGAGTEGVGIESSEAQYATSTSGTTPPSSGWQTSIPSVPPGEFLWTRMTVTFTDSTVQESYSVARAGADGADGRGIVSTAVNYAVSTSGTSAPSSGWQGTVPSVPEGQYLWTRTVITYTSGDPSTTYSVARQGQDGSPGAPGTDGRGVASSTTHYAVSSSGTTTPSSGWQTAIPSVPEGQFLWTRITWTFTSGPDHVTYSVARSGEDGAPGAPGSPGAPGADGRGVSSVTQFYWMGTSAPSTPTVSPPPAPWSTTEPTYTGGTQNLYGTVRTTYTSGSPNFTYSPVSLLASFQAAKTAYNLADSAMTLAGTKTKVMYSTSTPSGSAETNDVWRRQDGSGNIIGEWRYTGSGWQETQITNSVISNLDAGKITTGFLNAARLQAGTITAESGILADASVVTAKIADLAVATGKIANLAVTGAKIANLAVTGAKIADLAVTNAKIANATIQSAKIANLDAAKITSGSFEGKSFTGGTFTGSVFRTSASGQRVQMDSNGLRTFNASGVETARLSAENAGLKLGQANSFLGLTVDPQYVMVASERNPSTPAEMVTAYSLADTRSSGNSQKYAAFVAQHGAYGSTYQQLALSYHKMTSGAYQGLLEVTSGHMVIAVPGQLHLLANRVVLPGDTDGTVLLPGSAASGVTTVTTADLVVRSGWVMITVNVNISLPNGSTTNVWQGVPPHLCPPANRHGAAWMSGSHSSVAFIRPNGTIAVANQSGGTRTSVQTTITYPLP